MARCYELSKTDHVVVGLQIWKVTRTREKRRKASRSPRLARLRVKLCGGERDGRDGEEGNGRESLVLRGLNSASLHRKVRSFDSMTSLVVGACSDATKPGTVLKALQRYGGITAVQF